MVRSAGGGTRTPKPFPAPAPKAGASASSATPARRAAGRTDRRARTERDRIVAVTMAENDDGVRIEHPNRKKASSKLTRLVVVLLLLISAALVTIISIGGWDVIAGAKPVQVAYILLYVFLCFMVLRWSRGVLPLIAALAIVLLIFAAVSAPEWFERDQPGFTDPTIDEGMLGLLSAILVPVQLLLIAFAMRGFQQAWNVEVEHRDEPPPERRERSRDPSPAPA